MVILLFLLLFSFRLLVVAVLAIARVAKGGYGALDPFESA